MDFPLLGVATFPGLFKLVAVPEGVRVVLLEVEDSGTFETPANRTLFGVLTRFDASTAEISLAIPSPLVALDKISVPRVLASLGSTWTGVEAEASVNDAAFERTLVGRTGGVSTTIGTEEVLIITRLLGANEFSLLSLVTSRNFLFGFPNSH